MKTSCKRLLCLVLCLLMIVSCIPIAGAEGDTATKTTKDGSLAENPGSTQDDPSTRVIEDNTIKYEKQVKLDNDGTYTFQLESYVTGAVTPQPVPMDIVLVMDQSGSMKDGFMAELPKTLRYYTKAQKNTYANLMSAPLLLYKLGDGYLYRAKIERTNSGSYAPTAIALLGGQEYSANSYSQTVNTASGYNIPISGYHYAPNVVRYKLNYDNEKGYYYTSSDDDDYAAIVEAYGDKIGYWKTQQEAYAYMRTTFKSFYFSDYNECLYTVEDVLSDDITFYLPVYFRGSRQYTISYYKDGAWQTAEVDTSLSTTRTATDANSICSSTKLCYVTPEDSLQNSAYSFIQSIKELSKSQGVDHRIAVVGFGSGKDEFYDDDSNEGWGMHYVGTELLSTAETVGYEAAKADTTKAAYIDALQPALVDGDKVNSQLITAINRIEGEGGTFLNYGLEMANEILSARTDKTHEIGNSVLPRKTVVIVFTDGIPGDSDIYGEFANYDKCTAVNTANRSIAAAKTLKDAGAEVYCIGMLEEDIDPNASYNFTVTERTITIDPNGATDTSECYVEQDQAINAFMHFLSSDYPNATSMLSEDRKTVINNGYYYAAKNANTLDQAFQNISENVAVSTVELTASAVVRDVMAEGFDLPVDIESNPKKYVQVFTSDYLGNDQWGELVPTDKCFITTNRATKTVDVTGFEYQKHYVHEAYTENNGQTIPAGGKRLVITIRGVTANDEAIQNASVNTNDPSSGIYADSGVTELVESFDVPTEYLQKKVFTLDYFMPTEIPCVDVGVFTPLHLSATGMTEFSEYTTSIDCANGRVTLENGILNCIPTTGDFHEIDSFYLYGLDQNGENVWSKISLVPANNVFYEDDWATYSDKWTVVGEANGNTETLSNPVHGYIESKANETGYSNGSAHFSDYQYATAEFTFTGTGIDVYCRTDSECGVALAVLNPEGETVASQNLVMDVLSSSGTYYQIPTLFFHDLPYGTYTLKITIRDASYDGGRDDFYVDGFRVYNPLGSTADLANHPDSALIKEAYQNEFDSVYTSVRDLLINSSDLSAGIEGAVFIDEIKDESGSGSSTISSSLQDYISFGPKNEVYLASDNSIVLRVDPTAHYYLGIKSPTGNATVSFTYGEARKDVTINSAADLYYEVIPSADGYLEIKNTSGQLIALTKLRICGAEKGLSLRSATANEILDYANGFDALEQPKAPTIGAPTYTKAPKQPKLIFRKIKKPVAWREQQ